MPESATVVGDSTDQSDVPSEAAHHGRPTVAFAMKDRTLRDALFPPSVLDRLRRVADVIAEPVLDSYDTAEAAEVLARADVLISGWGAPRLTTAAVSRAPRLKLLAHSAGSVRGIFDPACYDRGVAVTTAAQTNAWPVAQWTLAMIILAGKRAQTRSRDFARKRSRQPAWTADLGNHAMTVGIIGASRIGRLVLGLLPPHGYRVLLADPTLSPAEASGLGAELVPLDRLMADSDVVSLHAPILESTKGMITAELLASMKDGATFINSARGILVDHDGLRTEAGSGRIDLVLDVTWPEPLPADDPLWEMPNVWLTPHLAGAQGRELAALGATAVAEVECLAAGRPYHFAVGPELYAQMA